MVEGFIFSYIGLTFWSYRQYRWSIELILGQFVILILGRAAGTIGVFYLTKRENESDPLNIKDVIYLFYSGLMRGSIAFGLVLRISEDFPDRDIILTTCLAMIVITTIIFGSTTGLMARLLLRSEEEKKEEGLLVA
jgi:NhaP-type Na+/H+ or K+/H+ antiporter